MWGGTSFGALSGGVGAELSGGDFWRGAGVGATVSLLNHYAHDGVESLEKTRARNKRAKAYAKQVYADAGKEYFGGASGLAITTGTASMTLSNFGDGGNYLHYLPKSNRFKVYNRPNVNQYTINTKIGVRGGALLFGVNQFSVYNDYQNGRISRDDLEIQSINNVLGSISPQMGAMFLSYEVIKYTGNMINKFLGQPEVIMFFNRMNSEIDYFMSGSSYSGFDY